MRVFVLGPTGVVGDAIVREALGDARITSIVAVARRPLEHADSRLASIVHHDFTHFEPLEPQLASADAVLCALGISWYQAKTEAAYRQITHDYVMACARVVALANPSARFCFVSGHGALGASSQAWARIKAETERDLDATFGSRLTVFRPGYIYPVYARKVSYWGDAIMRPFMPLRAMLDRWITDSVTVARAVLYAGMGGAVSSPAGNAEIARVASAYVSTRPASTV